MNIEAIAIKAINQVAADCSSPEPVLMFVYCMMGSLALYMINKLNLRPNFSVCSVLNIDVSQTSGRSWVILLDLVVSAAFAGLLIYIIADPVQPIQAVFSGLGATGVLVIAAGQTEGITGGQNGKK